MKSNTTRNNLLPCLILLAATPVWAGPLSISRVWPEKICYKPGETASMAVDVNNSVNTAQTAQVALSIRFGMEGKTDLPPQTLTIPAGGQTNAVFSYEVPKDRKWGHEAHATVTDESGTSVTGREYFAVGDDPWQVGHYTTRFWLRDAKKSGSTDNTLIPAFRRNYVTTLEAYGWAPSCFGGMVPQTDTWSSGMGAYWEGTEGWQYTVQEAHKIGMAVVTYVINWAAGPVGFEFVRKHPDWLTYGKDGRPKDVSFDLDNLEIQRTDPDKVTPGTYGYFMLSFLPSNPQAGDFWIDNIVNSTKMFGWDGLRVDGIPSVIGGYDYTGKLHELPDPGTANAEYIDRIHRKIRERFPKFLFGWNCVAAGNPFYAPPTEKERDAAFPGSSYTLFENFNSVDRMSNPFHAWKKLIPYLEAEVSAVRKYGSYSQCGWMKSNRYLEAIVSGCGSHVGVYEWQWAIPADLANYRRFEFRYSEFIWDNLLAFVRPAETAVSVEGSPQILWQDFVHTRDLADGGKRVVVHLVNMPENDEDAWANKPPAPAANVEVSFKALDGKTPGKIGVFSPDTPGDVVTVVQAADGSIAIPQVTLWTMVVAEY